MRRRFVPRYAVNRRSPEKMPIDNPGNVTSTATPSVLTPHEVVWNEALARLISDSLRGGPMISRPGLMTSGSTAAATPALDLSSVISHVNAPTIGVVAPAPFTATDEAIQTSAVDVIATVA